MHKHDSLVEGAGFELSVPLQKERPFREASHGFPHTTLPPVLENSTTAKRREVKEFAVCALQAQRARPFRPPLTRTSDRTSARSNRSTQRANFGAAGAAGRGERSFPSSGGARARSGPPLSHRCPVLPGVGHDAQREGRSGAGRGNTSIPRPRPNPGRMSIDVRVQFYLSPDTIVAEPVHCTCR